MTRCDGLRVLLVGTYPPPFGGIASHLTTLIPGLKARGAEDVAVLSFAGREGVETRDGFTVYRFSLKRESWRLLNPANWGVAYRVYRTLGPHGVSGKTLLIEAVKAVLIDSVARRHRSHVISAYQCDMNLALLPLAGMWGGARAIVLTVFGEIYEETSGQFLRDHAALVRELLEVPVAVASSSCHCARAYTTIGVSRTIEPVYYGVELDRVQSADLRESFRREHGFTGSDVVVLFMSRFSKEMGLDVLLTAAAQLLEHPSIRLVLAGARGDESARAATVAAAHPGRVVILQDVPFAKQGAVYNGTDLLVAPSFNQRACMGMAIKEAMAVGLPVVGGAGGGVPEAVVEGQTGFLVPLDASGSVDVTHLINSISRLVDEPETRQRFGNAGRRRAEQLFSSEKTNERMAQIFMAARPTAGS
jgi:glycosyltransferase involved in cell wall biosynthesis